VAQYYEITVRMRVMRCALEHDLRFGPRRVD